LASVYSWLLVGHHYSEPKLESFERFPDRLLTILLPFKRNSLRDSILES